MREAELEAGSALVDVLKNGRRRVTKKRLIAKYGGDKSAIVRESLKHPKALAAYKQSKEGRKSKPLSLDDIASITDKKLPDWDALYAAVAEIPGGKDDSGRYERAVEALFTALFYPVLTSPISQHRIHEGRKRIDISYTNMATAGFFRWLSSHYPSAQIFVECKNYTREVDNPELDQLSSRFSPSRGRVGLLVCRKFDDKAKFERRCRDTVKDDRGYIIALDDDDVAGLTSWRRDNSLYEPFPLLREKFQN